MRIVNSLVGRFQNWNLENLPYEEAVEAIRRYAQHTKTQIKDQTVEQIWNLTEGNPLCIRELLFSTQKPSGTIPIPKKQWKSTKKR